MSKHRQTLLLVDEKEQPEALLFPDIDYLSQISSGSSCGSGCVGRTEEIRMLEGIPNS